MIRSGIFPIKGNQIGKLKQTLKAKSAIIKKLLSRLTNANRKVRKLKMQQDVSNVNKTLLNNVVKEKEKDGDTYASIMIDQVCKKKLSSPRCIKLNL